MDSEEKGEGAKQTPKFGRAVKMPAQHREMASASAQPRGGFLGFGESRKGVAGWARMG